MSAATVVHGSIAFLFLAFGCHLLGYHVGRYGFRRGFIERENRARMYTTGALFVLAVFWPQMFPAANQILADSQVIMLAAAAVVFLLSYLWAHGVGRWRPFKMSDHRHTDVANAFSVGIPRGWRRLDLSELDISKGYVLSLGTPDKQAMLSIACVRGFRDAERWKRERLEAFEQFRLQFDNPSLMRTPNFSLLPYGAIGGEKDVLYARFRADRPMWPSVCDERFVLVRSSMGYVIDHFVTSESDVDIGVILVTWRIEPSHSGSVISA
jgi:hypothetical protein